MKIKEIYDWQKRNKNKKSRVSRRVNRWKHDTPTIRHKNTNLNKTRGKRPIRDIQLGDDETSIE